MVAQMWRHFKLPDGWRKLASNVTGMEQYKHWIYLTQVRNGSTVLILKRHPR